MLRAARQTTAGEAKTSEIKNATDPKRFDWPLAYEAEKFLRQRVETFLQANTFAHRLSHRMRDETGTDFFEWIDHLALSPEDEKPLRQAGFILDAAAETPNGELVLHHPRATLPRVMLRAGSMQNPSSIALRPESVADFAARHDLSGEIEGAPLSRYRQLIVSEENGTRLEAVERHGYRGFVSTELRPGQLEAILKAKELWHTRKRSE